MPVTAVVYRAIAGLCKIAYLVMLIAGSFDAFHDEGEDFFVRTVFGVVGLRHGLPLYAVRFQDLLYAVIVRYVTEPAVELREDDQIEVMTLHTVQQPDKFFSFCVFLPGLPLGLLAFIWYL